MRCGISRATTKCEFMVQAVTPFVKRSSATGAVQVAETARELAATPIEIRSVPLRLGPLLGPYKGHGRVAVRVERLPYRTRLSAGQNNGDQSWSVLLDELGDLCFQFPSDLQDAPTLAIRVINRDGGTVAVLDYRVSLSDASPEPDRQGGETPRATPEDAIRGLHAELAKAKEELSARESAFVELQQRAARNWEEQSQKRIDEALGAASSQWEADTEKLLAAATDRADSAFEAAQRTWQNEHDARLAESERRTRELAAQDRLRWQHEADTALAMAREDWNAGEASRLVAAQARWRNETAAAALADARTEAQRSQGEHAELERLRAELAAAKRLLSGSEVELAKVRSDVDQERVGWRQGTQTAIARAQKAWKTDEDARFVAAETRWREQFAAALAESVAARKRIEAALLEAHASAKSADGKRDQAELQRSQDELTAQQLAMTSAQAEFALAREQWRQETDARLVQARKEWKADEYARIAAAETRWRDQSAIALAEAIAGQKRAEAALSEVRAQEDAPRSQPNENEMRRLQDGIASLQSKLDHRETDFVQARAHWLHESEEKLARAAVEWRASETARLGEAEARIREESKRSFDTVAARLQQAEAELAELRARPKTETESNDHLAILRLRDELEKARIALEVRDIELRHARSATTQALARFRNESEPGDNLPQSGFTTWPGRRDKRNVVDAKLSRPLWRDVAIVAGLAALVTVLYPTLVSLLPDEWVAEYGSESDAPAPPHAPVVKPAPRSAPPVVELPSDTVIRTAKVHADPSKSSAVLASLPADMKITPLGQRGNWVLVSIDGLDGAHKHQQGWVYASYLSAAPVSPKAAEPAAQH